MARQSLVIGGKAKIPRFACSKPIKCLIFEPPSLYYLHMKFSESSAGKNLPLFIDNLSPIFPIPLTEKEPHKLNCDTDF